MEVKNDIGRRIRILNNTLKRRADSTIAESGVKDLSGVNMFMLGYVSRLNGQNRTVYQKDLEERFGITRSAVSRSLDLLEQKGMIVRKADETDSRRKQIVITDKARQLESSWEAGCLKTETDLLKGFSAEELEQLKSMLDRLLANMGESIEEEEECI